MALHDLGGWDRALLAGRHRHDQVVFQCNICGAFRIAPAEELDREAVSCPACGSNVRFRSIVAILSRVLFGRNLPLGRWPLRKDIKGIGLSDWEGYANILEEKLDYTNTYYDRAPTLDITDPPAIWEHQLNFLIASEVFEHVPPPVGRAFAGAHRMLRPGGCLLLTVPYILDESETVEHFPELHDWRVDSSTEGAPILINQTRDGEIQTFPDLIFHGGVGLTLEMRVFTLDSLRQELERAGFHDICVERQSDLAYWHEPRSVPITARA